MSTFYDQTTNRFKTVKSGEVRVEWDSQLRNVRLILTDDNLVIQKEELVYTQSPIDTLDSNTLNKERLVLLRREKVGGLGLSVKGGSEHNLPILISRIFKDQSADNTGQLYVGDAILKVNSQNIEDYTHDEAVQCLKNAGDTVTLIVKYFRPASLFLSTRRRDDLMIDQENANVNSNQIEPEQQWTTILTIPLLAAYISRYVPGTDEILEYGFEVIGLEGQSSGVVRCENATQCEDWIQSITYNIQNTDNISIQQINKTLLPSEHVHHMCWVCEKIGTAKLAHTWRRLFLVFKSQEILMYDLPPVKTRDWSRCESSNKIYECMLKILKPAELEDSRKHCVRVETGHGMVYYLSFGSRQELLRLETAWHSANFHAVKQIQTRTFGCKWRNNICGLTLDLKSGFSLYDSQSKTYMWSYRFSQLKGSSDDSHTVLKLHFLNEELQSLEMREIECTNLQTLLFAMHAFLSAKLASVDPNFLVNS